MSISETVTAASVQQADASPTLRSLVLTVLLVWILSVPCAEIIFRLLGERTTTDLAGLYQTFGRIGGYKLRPNVRADADTLISRYSVLTNEFGLRCGNADLQPGAAGRHIDILVLGDSQAYGEGLSYENTLAGRLNGLAGEQGMVVNNAGVGGHYLENQFELLQWLDDQGVRPRRVVILLTPYLIASSDRYNRAYVGPDGRLYDKEDSIARRHLTSWFKRHTVVYGRLRNAIDRFHPAASHDLTPVLVKFYSRAEETRYQEQLAQFLKRFSAWCAGRHIDILLVYTPGVVELTFDPVAQAGRLAGVEVDRNGPYEAASSSAAALGIPFLDLRPALESEHRGNQHLTIPDNAHYSAPVSAALARRIWEAAGAGAPAAQRISSSTLNSVANRY